MNRRDEAPRRIDQPEPGYYKCRLVKGGPDVGAVIRRYYPSWSALPVWCAEIDGKPAGADTNPWLVEGIDRAWTGTRIDEAEYLRLLKRDRSIPADRPVDLLTMKPPF